MMISLMVVPSSYTNHAWLGQFFAGACTVGAVLLGEGRDINCPLAVVRYVIELAN
jgi:hypothetical protein